VHANSEIFGARTCEVADMLKIIIIVGARPQFIKSAPIVREMLACPDIELKLIHSGQHYADEMSDIFFRQLNLPQPIENLGVGSGTHAIQTAAMLEGLEKTLLKYMPDLVIVVGDTNTTLAGALATSKLQIPLAHVEAGMRSYDMSMPEEINRKLTDHCSTLLFSPTLNAAINLVNEGIPSEKIFVTGDTMVDACYQHLFEAKDSTILARLKLDTNDYLLITLHRQENVDNKGTLKGIIEALIELRDLKVVFPIHPRTYSRLREFGILEFLYDAENIIVEKPLEYLEFLYLMHKAKLVLTDSGGIQKEAYILGVPCLTLRYNTEWIETLNAGINILCGTEKKNIIHNVKHTLENPTIEKKMKHLPKLFGDGNAAKRILKIILEKHNNAELNIERSNYLKEGYPVYATYFVEKGSKLDGVYLSEIEKRFPKIKTLLSFDPSGNPIYPSDEIKVINGHVIHTHGPKDEQQNLLKLTKKET
jgi:UDP-N-acetylglucosamine 2-epimerase (non-hydrolysing)